VKLTDGSTVRGIGQHDEKYDFDLRVHLQPTTLFRQCKGNGKKASAQIIGRYTPIPLNWCSTSAYEMFHGVSSTKMWRILYQFVEIFDQRCGSFSLCAMHPRVAIGQALERVFR